MNSILLVLLIAAVAALIAWRVWRPSKTAPTRSARDLTPPPPPLAAPVTVPVHDHTPAPAAATPWTLPPELAAFRRTSADDLSPADLAALQQRLQTIPRPPRALHQLVSPDFVQTATSLELAELVLSEPHIAAKVLATVNSPLYGLSRPVVSIGQGITFLGLNTVRGISLRYLLDQSFPAQSPAVKAAFDELWLASALASELCSRLAPRLGDRDTGTRVTQVVLSYLGHLAALSLLPANEAAALHGQPLLERTQKEQAVLGVGGAELGRLLMQSWQLPAALVADVARVDRWLEGDAGTDNGQALCYLCARLGERLARSHGPDEASAALVCDDSLELQVVAHHLRARHGTPLDDALAAPDLQQALLQMLENPNPAN